MSELVLFKTNKKDTFCFVLKLAYYKFFKVKKYLKLDLYDKTTYEYTKYKNLA